MAVTVGRHINGIMLNDLEYILDEENGEIAIFENKEEAIRFLEEQGVTEEEMYFFVFDEVDDEGGAMTNSENNEITLKALRKVAKFLKTAEQKYIKKHAEIVERRKQILKATEYGTLYEIQEAYGYGLITDDEREALTEALETGEKKAEEATAWSEAARMLRVEINDFEQEIRDMEWQALTPREREKRLKEQAEFVAEQAARKAKRQRAGQQ